VTDGKQDPLPRMTLTESEAHAERFVRTIKESCVSRTLWTTHLFCLKKTWRREWDSIHVLVCLVNNLLILQNARIARNATIANLRHVLGTQKFRVGCVPPRHRELPVAVFPHRKLPTASEVRS